MSEPVVKCARTVCKNEGQYLHSQNGRLYCFFCARKINKLNACDMPEGKELIPIPKIIEKVKKCTEKSCTKVK